MEFRILVVDDEESLVSTLTEIFFEKGYLVSQALSGEEAVEAFDRQPADLVLLDLQMPGLSGADVLRHIRAKAPQTRVVVVTAFPERENEVKPLGYDAFVQKPFAMERLVRTVDSLLTRKDEEELKTVTMPEELEQASPGEPLADILILEPVKDIAAPIIYFLRHPEPGRGYGTYHFSWADDLSQAMTVLFAMRPDLVMVDLLTVPAPADAVKQLTSCEYQPKDYLFYFHRPLPPERQQVLNTLSFKHWQGNPWKERELETLGSSSARRPWSTGWSNGRRGRWNSRS
ncbi:MAG: response regulator [Candidatus Omnitrophica bacterium]|nr:response regulator [Candidatus Omnitrophota bacterium]